MFTPATSRHFTARRDPESGVLFYVLSTRIAPVQQGFYFVNSGYSDDGRYLWFYCAFPPSLSRTLAVIDFLTDAIHHFPDTDGGGWAVEGSTGNLWWGTAQGIFMRSPHPGDKAIKIADLPKEAIKARAGSAGTHLTFTPDGKEVLLDIQTGQGSLIGTLSVSTGEFRKWYRTEKGVPYNHAQLCPTNPDLCLCAHEYSYDAQAGVDVPPPLTEEGFYPRLQLIGRDGSREMRPPLGNYATHEWWSADGKSIFYCNNKGDEDQGGLLVRDRLGDSKPEAVCSIPIPGGVGTWHGHCTADEKYFVADGSYFSMGRSCWRGCESTVRFYNTETRKLLTVVTLNPVVEGWTPDNPCPYHIDPHPRFVLNDTLITFTTTVCGRVDLAVVPVESLVSATRG